MKNTFFKTIFLLGIIILTSSCGNEEPNPTYNQQISLKADGVFFSVKTGDAGVEKAEARIRDGNKFQLDATAGGKDFSINNYSIPGVGTYVMSGPGIVSRFFQWEDGSSLFTSLGPTNSRLTLTITRVAGNSSDYLRSIEGTFSGVVYNTLATDSVKITDGQIRIIED